MNRNPDVELVLRDYFADDGYMAPDHVLDVVEERIMRQPQRRVWRFLRRDSHVNSYLKPLLAVAAVVVIAVAGFAMFRQPSGSGVGGAGSPAPSPSPIPSATPSTAASASAGYPDRYTTLPAGKATTRQFVSGSTFNVPAGWVNDVDTSDYYRLFKDTPGNKAEFARSDGPAQNIFMGLVDTPAGLVCEGVGNAEGSTPAELVGSLVADKALVTSKPIDVTIGAWTGTRVDAHLDPDWTGSCGDNPGAPPTQDQKDHRSRFIFLDSPNGHRILIIVDSIHSADFDPWLAEAMPIVESFQFEDWQ